MQHLQVSSAVRHTHKHTHTRIYIYIYVYVVRRQRVNRLVLVTMVESVYGAVRTDSVHQVDYVSSLKG
jgi:hypothetical protein